MEETPVFSYDSSPYGIFFITPHELHETSILGDLWCSDLIYVSYNLIFPDYNKSTNGMNLLLFSVAFNIFFLHKSKIFGSQVTDKV